MKIIKSSISLFKSIDLSDRNIPLIYADSGKSGPIVWLTAAIHGNEINGTAVVHEVFNRLKNNQLKKGVLYAFPILNPSGFETMSRYEQYEEEDLNRHFDGTDRGTMAEKQATLILNKILDTKPSCLIDLHTDSLNSIAYTMIDAPLVLQNKNYLLGPISLARALHLPWAIDTDKNAGYNLDRCLTGKLVSLGIPAVTVELGGPLLVSEKFKRIGFNAVWNVLEKLGMIGNSEEKLDDSIPEKINVFEERITALNTGIIEYMIRPGNTVRKGTSLGVIKNVFGDTIETIKAIKRAKVFSHEDQSLVFPGQTLFTLAVNIKFDNLKL